MATESTGTPNNVNQEPMQGLSTDAKPVDVKTGSVYYELDTGDYWVFSEENANPATTNGWWKL